MEVRAINDECSAASGSATPERDKLLAKARENPRCTVIERKPGRVIATFLDAAALERVKRQLGK
jgi:hypothetical protein